MGFKPRATEKRFSTVQYHHRPSLLPSPAAHSPRRKQPDALFERAVRTRVCGWAVWSAAEGRGQQGRLFFASFLLAKQKKGTRSGATSRFCHQSPCSAEKEKRFSNAIAAHAIPTCAAGNFAHIHQRPPQHLFHSRQHAAHRLRRYHRSVAFVWRHTTRGRLSEP